MLRVRFSKDELEILKIAAENAGFDNLSAFIRAVTIGKADAKKKILQEIRDDVKEILIKLSDK
jgi:hypothetical protein